MNYKFSTPAPSSHFIEIEATLTRNSANEVEVQLPAWRPGRYELQNFAKNIQHFTAFDLNGNQLQAKKITKDKWLVKTLGCETVVFRYNYYANEQNAGSSFLDNSMFYVNPVNCCIYVEGRIDEEISLEIQGNDFQKMASGLDAVYKNGFFYSKASDFYHLADSPFLLSENLQHQIYEVNDIPFHIWVAGNIEIPWEKVVADFQKFTTTQLEIFGEFPEKDFHFLLWVLPTAFYHGVEHRNSTMMVLGPDNQPFDEMYIDLLGLASHELFHAWNICKIRPVELLPYDFTKENYFETCFIAEGITTFYGDWTLFKSGVFDEEQYNKELETRYRRHFETADEAKQSLLESSYDLWLDGYSKSIPERKVSVYFKGAIVTEILNERLISEGKSMDDVLKVLWLRFGKPFVGYSYDDYKEICEEILQKDVSDYFETCIEGCKSLWNEIKAMNETRNLHLTKAKDGKVSLLKI